MPLSLSIVIPSYQRTDLLRACLESIELHAPPNLEIIVVDDASPGGGPERLALLNFAAFVACACRAAAALPGRRTQVCALLAVTLSSFSTTTPKSPPAGPKLRLPHLRTRGSGPSRRLCSFIPQPNLHMNAAGFGSTVQVTATITAAWPPNVDMVTRFRKNTRSRDLSLALQLRARFIVGRFSKKWAASRSRSALILRMSTLPFVSIGKVGERSFNPIRASFITLVAHTARKAASFSKCNRATRSASSGATFRANLWLVPCPGMLPC